MFATLRQYLPKGSDRLSMRLELPAGSTAFDVLTHIGISNDQAALLLVDGHYETNRQRPLPEKCTVSIWPHVAGG